MNELERETLTSTKIDSEVKENEFSLENQEIKLDNLPRYEDLIAPQINTKLDNMQEVENLPLFEPRKEEKAKKPAEIIQQKRFKIAVSTFAIIGVLLFACVLINGVSLAMLARDVDDNKNDINALTEEVESLENQGFDIDSGLIEGGAENMSYKLALPRNYPDNTADLTWFDKLSIFLMKLFG